MTDLKSNAKDPLIPNQIISLTDPEKQRELMSKDIVPGQVWLAEASSASEFVLVIAKTEDPRTMTVVPLSNNVKEQTERSLVIQETPLGSPMIAWPQLEATIPIRLLRIPLGDMPADIVNAIKSDETNSALGISRGAVPRYSTGLENRHLLTRALRFIQWQKACEHLPQLGQSKQLEYKTDDNASDYMDALMDVLGLTPAECIEISRGGRQLTEKQQKLMEKAGYSTPIHHDEAIPDAYLIMAEQPRWNYVVNKFDTVPESEVRMRLARTAAFELAARPDGVGSDALEALFRKAASNMLEEENSK